MSKKQATKIYLKSGKEIVVSLQQGVLARKAKLGGSGSFVIADQNNRIIDVAMMGEIEDVWIEDVQVQLGEQLHEVKRILPENERVKPTATSPGYIKFLLAERRLKRKHGGKLRKLTEEQAIIIDEIEEREAFEKSQ